MPVPNPTNTDNVIDADTYQAIVVYYSGAMQQIATLASDYYYPVAEAILGSDEFTVEMDLLKPMYQAYITALSAYTDAPGSVIAAIAALQKHVLTNAIDPETSTRYTALNTWIDDNSIAIDTTFASLSTQAGYPIAVTA